MIAVLATVQVVRRHELLLAPPFWCNTPLAQKTNPEVHVLSRPPLPPSYKVMGKPMVVTPIDCVAYECLTLTNQ